MPLPTEIRFTLAGAPILPPPTPVTTEPERLADAVIRGHLELLALEAGLLRATNGAAPEPPKRKKGEPAPPPPAADAGTFGAEWAGDFVLRVPTIGDEIAIPAKVTAYIARLGTSPQEVPLGTYRLVLALVYFAQLATDKPDWLDADAPASPLGQLAFLRAHQLAQETIAAEKKRPVPAGAS